MAKVRLPRINVPGTITEESILSLHTQELPYFPMKVIREFDFQGMIDMKDRNFAHGLYKKLIAARGYERASMGERVKETSVRDPARAAFCYDASSKAAFELDFRTANITFVLKANEFYRVTLGNYMPELLNGNTRVCLRVLFQGFNFSDGIIERYRKCPERFRSENLGSEEPHVWF